jgi:microcystin-dependent protein
MDPFLGQIVMFGGNFAPRAWAFCDGTLLPINSYSALFSILGTTYGGDGRTTFALPDLRGRVAMHAGHGPGLADRRLGQKGGEELVTLNPTQIPAHNHNIHAANVGGDDSDPTTAKAFATASGDLYSDSTQTGTMNSNIVTNTGGGQGHDNMQPFLCVNYIICLQGLFPSRN